MCEFRKYAVVVNKASAETFKILKYSPLSDEVIIIQLEIDKLAIFKISITDLESNYEVISDYSQPLRDISALSDKEMKSFEKRCKVFDYIDEHFDEDDLLISESRIAIFEALKSQKLIGKTQFYELVRRYLQSGMSRASLITNFSKCGLKGVRHKHSKKPGLRKGSGKMPDGKFIQPDKPNGIIVDEVHTKNIKKALNKYYFNTSKRNIKDAYNHMIIDSYSNVENHHGIPTYNQMRYIKNNMLNSELQDFEELIKKRIGEKQFNLTKRQLLGDTFDTGDIPGATFEIDASIPNIQLVDETRTKVIGKPILYLVIDSYTKLVVGLHVGLDHPSWNMASSALFNCFENKVEFCKKYDIEILPDEWVTAGLPRAILADKGEFAGSMPEDIANYLNVEIRNTPSGRPDLKPNVERYFRLFEDKLKNSIPGFKLYPRKRGEKDIQFEAVLTLEEITRVFILTALYFNKHLFKGYKATADMIRDKVHLSPNKIWEWSVRNIGVDAFFMNREIIMFALMKSGTASVTERGVNFQNLYYTNQELEAKQWFSKARHNGRSKIEIKFDERNMDEIYIFQDDLRLITLKQTKPTYRVYANKSFVEIMDLEKIKKEIINESIDVEIENESDFILNIENIVKNAKKEIKSNSLKKPSVNEKRKNNIEEAEKIRKSQALNYDYVEEDDKNNVIIDNDTKSSYEQRINQKLLQKAKRR